MDQEKSKETHKCQRMRKAAGWDDALLTEVLAQVF
jgi:hypothetical protein